MEKSYVANNLIKILIFLPCNLPRGLKKKQTKPNQTNEIIRHTFGIEIPGVPQRAGRGRQLRH